MINALLIPYAVKNDEATDKAQWHLLFCNVLCIRYLNFLPILMLITLMLKYATVFEPTGSLRGMQQN